MTEERRANVLHNTERWMPRLQAIQEWVNGGVREAALFLEAENKLKHLDRSSYTPECLDALKSATADVGGSPSPFDADQDERVRLIVGRMLPLLEKHKQEVFAMFVKALLPARYAKVVGQGVPSAELSVIG
jgi:hypothetical protein